MLRADIQLLMVLGVFACLSVWVIACLAAALAFVRQAGEEAK